VTDSRQSTHKQSKGAVSASKQTLKIKAKGPMIRKIPEAFDVGENAKTAKDMLSTVSQTA
jgi:hypothetical protein